MGSLYLNQQQVSQTQKCEIEQFRNCRGFGQFFTPSLSDNHILRPPGPARGIWRRRPRVGAGSRERSGGAFPGRAGNPPGRGEDDRNSFDGGSCRGTVRFAGRARRGRACGSGTCADADENAAGRRGHHCPATRCPRKLLSRKRPSRTPTPKTLLPKTLLRKTPTPWTRRSST